MVRLLIVDKSRLMCDALAAALHDQSDMLVIGAATQVPEALAHLAACDVALISAGLPDAGVRQLVQAAAGLTPPVRTLVVGISEDAVLGYLEAGAAGYLLREESVDDLVPRIWSVYEGRPWLSPRVTAALMSRLAELARFAHQAPLEPAQPGEMVRSGSELTLREQQVLGLLARGLSNHEIAERLAIETGTVKNHVHSILRKLKVNNRYQAALAQAPGAPLSASSLLAIPAARVSTDRPA